MAEHKRTFTKGIMNKDLDERLIPDGQYVDALNVDVGSFDGSDFGSVKNKKGNTKVADLHAVSGVTVSNARTIGAKDVEANNLIYWLVASDFFDGIYEYNETTGETVRVLQSNKATPTTPSKLNFSQEYLVTGIDHVMTQDGAGFLFWTDDNNEPKGINISRAKSYDIDDDAIDIDTNVILEPPLYSPHVEPYSDNTDLESNNMYEKFLYFAYRYKYVDNRYSSMSPVSAVSFIPRDYQFDYSIGNNTAMLNFYNSCYISFETGNELVEAIQLILIDTRNINASIIETYSKKENPNILNDSSYRVSFKNNKIYSVLPTDQVTRLFDNVPLKAKAQSIIGNRLAYGNYVQYRDIVNCDGEEIAMNYDLKITSRDATEEDPKTTWRSDRDYEVGLIYTDEYGRMTTVLTSPENSLYIPASVSHKANSIVMNIKHQPPCWATNYRIAVKQTRGDYYNIFPLIFYKSGLFRYFFIGDYDRDKLKVGDYLIFKSDLTGPTNSNQKYKVLEITNKAFGSFGTGSPAGLYFKIKVYNDSELDPSALTNISSWSNGVVPKLPWGYCNTKVNPPAVRNPFRVIENPIYYGPGQGEKLTLVSNSPTSSLSDQRLILTVNNNGTLRLSTIPRAFDDESNINLSIPITSGVMDIGYPVGSSGPTSIFKVVMNPNAPYIPGEKWIFMYRAYDPFYNENVGTSIVNIWGDGPDIKIRPGALITIGVNEQYSTKGDGGSTSSVMTFPPSPVEYDNIEEWFYESGVRNENFAIYNKGGDNVCTQNFSVPGTNGQKAHVMFRRGINMLAQKHQYFPADFTAVTMTQGGSITPATLAYPVRMIIMGTTRMENWTGGINFSALCGSGILSTNITLRQQEVATVCETVPIDTQTDIYHETSRTYPIEDGKHKVLWGYDYFEFLSTGRTRLVQQDRTRPHYFTVGNKVTVYSDNSGYFPSGNYNVIEIENRYSVIVNVSSVGGPVGVGGRIRLQDSEEQDQDGFTNAVVELNNPNDVNADFNAWTWGTGLEANRIRDDFNDTTYKFSPRATTAIDNYKQVRQEASICYSGVFNANSAYNRLNEFNLSLSNFKYLDRDFASIQKMYPRNTDLLVWQENKISTVLYGKNVLYDSIGGGQVVSVPDVLGQQIAFDGEFGISKNPESFANWGDKYFFTDARRGAVLSIEGDSLEEISKFGLEGYFRDLMDSSFSTQKLGGYDPYNEMYVLSSNLSNSNPCELSLSRYSATFSKKALQYNFFEILTTEAWSISLLDTGDGTGWVAGFPGSGTGGQLIEGELSENLTGSNRSVTFVVTYCSGKTQEFILTQAKGISGGVVVGVFNGGKIKK